MALSRLRHPVISRAPSLLRARLLSSSTRSLTRTFSLQNSTALGDNTLLRPVTGVHDIPSKLKPWTCVKYYSTQDPLHTVIGMPALSPTMAQGNIAKWFKKEGDKIEPGDILCEIETDKATVEFESLEEGFLAKILVPEGSKDVPVGQPIAITVEDADDIQNLPANVVSGSEVKEDIPAPQNVKNEVGVQDTSSVGINTSELPPHIVVEMPALSPTMSQGNIFKWIKKEGDKIEVGDIICEIETDKATIEYECLEEGYLAKILAPEGTKDIAVGQPIAVTVEDAADLETVKNAVGSGSAVKEEKPVHQDTRDVTKSEKTSILRISPAAKLLVTEHGLDTSSLQASGAHGTLLKGDVLAAIKSGIGSSKVSSREKTTPSLLKASSTHAPISAESKPSKQTDSFEDFPNSQIRKVIATRLQESKQNIPHLYLSSDVLLDPLLSLRKDLIEQHNAKVSVNDIVIKAVAVALRNVPEANVERVSRKGDTSTKKGKAPMLVPVDDILFHKGARKHRVRPASRPKSQEEVLKTAASKKAEAEAIGCAAVIVAGEERRLLPPLPTINPIFPPTMGSIDQEGEPSSSRKRKYKEEVGRIHWKDLKVAMQPNSFRYVNNCLAGRRSTVEEFCEPLAEDELDRDRMMRLSSYVEDADDIQNLPANVVSGSEVKEDIPAPQNVKNEVGVQDTSSVGINTSELPPHIVVEMPALSPTMSQGNIFKWIKKEGDKIEVGDIICEIETDKATIEYECLEEGYLAKILAPEGTKDIAVGQPIAVTVEDAADLETVKNAVGSGSAVKEEKPVHQDTRDVTKSEKTSILRISPAAKLLVTEHGLDTSSLQASGAHGTLLKGDVLAAIKSGIGSSKVSSREKTTPSLLKASSTHAPISAESKPSKQTDSFEDFPNSQIRKVIATRLQESKQNIPHLYLSSDVLLDPLLSLRKDLIEQHNAKVSVNDIVIKAVAVALRNVPEANAYWDAEKGEVFLCDSIDISIAVATEKGLMTPIVKNADQKSISAISAEVKELAEKARAGKLKPNEFQGGTFSISNLGMFPVDTFCAIINPPQASILAVGRGNKVVEPVIGSDGIERPAVVTKMNLTLSADHRVFDGKVGGSFLSALRSNFRDIRRLLL